MSLESDIEDKVTVIPVDWSSFLFHTHNDTIHKVTAKKQPRLEK